MPSGGSSGSRRTIVEQENILNGIFSPDPPFSSLETNFTRIGLISKNSTLVPYSNPQAQTLPGPNLPQISISNSLYFATEPNESPTSPTSKSIVEHPTQISPIISEEFSPNHNLKLLPGPQILEPPSSATPETTPSSNSNPESPPLDQTLANVFTHLAIKRKPSEETEHCRSSKLLRLCAPEPVPNPLAHTSQFPTNLPSKSKPTRTRKSFKRGVPHIRTSKAGDVVPDFLGSESCLCDVPVQQSLNRVEAELLLAHSNLEASSETDGRVAGPKQPHAQC
ncbi:hypothetical protein RHMOL_Rhmol06G0248800 [Rhododendron molle]|uniref:Uncharacterized protein n=1 Tax=Rhododendron molle TaxID=49168 RepID=A0ACC0NFS4_RHOML|nr:hypothetical protein RHMOL_Rhmol06G0248800 [Rhododendron molle]